MAEVVEVTRGKATKRSRRFDNRDFEYIAQHIIDERDLRKSKRRDRELHWKDIDRQIAMIPDVAFKKLPNGTADQSKMWMSEIELPLQAQASEVLTADARRMMFAGGKKWFQAHTEVTDEYLRQVDFGSMILGDENDVPSIITQDNADKLAEGYLLHLYRQNDFFTRQDRINSESFKYGTGVGRGVMQRKNVYIHEARGVRSEKSRIPVLVPTSIKNVYLDIPVPSVHTAQMLGSSPILEENIRLENLAIAVNKGSTDPMDMDGGWMPKMLARVEPDDKGFVELLEMEGDIVIPRKSVKSVVIPGAIVTVAVGQGSHAVVRFRFRQTPFSSYLLYPYQYEHIDDPYATGPLEKGRTVQIAASQAINRLMDSAALKNSPPVGYDRSDQTFTKDGGPQIYPNAMWGTTDLVQVYAEIGGDPAVMAAVLSQFISLYADLTGVLPARLGAQTVSHTTAFAKGAELERGASRTVDYVDQSGQGPLTRWLDMSYQMGRSAMKPNEKVSFYIKDYGGYVEVGKNDLPETALFEWFGAAGPAEERAKTQERLQSLQLALQMDQLGQAAGKPPTIDLDAAIQSTLREGGWTDVEALTVASEPAGGNPVQLSLPGVDEPDSGLASTALQALAFGDNQAA